MIQAKCLTFDNLAKAKGSMTSLLANSAILFQKWRHFWWFCATLRGGFGFKLSKRAMLIFGGLARFMIPEGHQRNLECSCYAHLVDDTKEGQCLPLWKDENWWRSQPTTKILDDFKARTKWGLRVFLEPLDSEEWLNFLECAAMQYSPLFQSITIRISILKLILPIMYILHSWVFVSPSTSNEWLRWIVC